MPENNLTSVNSLPLLISLGSLATYPAGEFAPDSGVAAVYGE